MTQETTRVLHKELSDGMSEIVGCTIDVLQGQVAVSSTLHRLDRQGQLQRLAADPSYQIEPRCFGNWITEVVRQDDGLWLKLTNSEDPEAVERLKAVMGRLGDAIEDRRVAADLLDYPPHLPTDELWLYLWPTS